MSHYNKDFDIGKNSFNFSDDLAFGHIGEDSVRKFYASVIQGASEIKTDRYRNGRMVVETQQNPRRKRDENDLPIWENSGINVTKADWWIYIYSLGQGFVIVSVQRLKKFLRSHPERFNESTKMLLGASGDNPAKGFILESQEVMRMLYSEEYD